MDIDKLVEYLKKYKDQVEIIELEKILLDSTRKKEGQEYGTLKIAVPDEVVKNIRGIPSKKDLILLLIIPNEIRKKIESPIIIL